MSTEFLPFVKPYIDEDTIAAVGDVLEEMHVTLPLPEAA